MPSVRPFRCKPYITVSSSPALRSATMNRSIRSSGARCKRKAPRGSSAKVGSRATASASAWRAVAALSSREHPRLVVGTGGYAAGVALAVLLRRSPCPVLVV